MVFGEIQVHCGGYEDNCCEFGLAFACYESSVCRFIDKLRNS